MTPLGKGACSPLPRDPLDPETRFKGDADMYTDTEDPTTEVEQIEPRFTLPRRRGKSRASLTALLVEGRKTMS
jgi:hypothetical protein